MSVYLSVFNTFNHTLSFLHPALYQVNAYNKPLFDFGWRFKNNTRYSHVGCRNNYLFDPFKYLNFSASQAAIFAS